MLETIHNEEGQFTIKELAVTGADIMKKFKLTPGPLV
jgi:hypothetical protein